jgi:hypothetical protein
MDVNMPAIGSRHERFFGGGQLVGRVGSPYARRAGGKGESPAFRSIVIPKLNCTRLSSSDRRNIWRKAVGPRSRRRQKFGEIDIWAAIDLESPMTKGFLIRIINVDHSNSDCQKGQKETWQSILRNKILTLKID